MPVLGILQMGKRTWGMQVLSVQVLCSTWMLISPHRSIRLMPRESGVVPLVIDYTCTYSVHQIVELGHSVFNLSAH